MFSSFSVLFISVLTVTFFPFFIIPFIVFTVCFVETFRGSIPLLDRWSIVSTTLLLVMIFGVGVSFPFVLSWVIVVLTLLQ